MNFPGNALAHRWFVMLPLTFHILSWNRFGGREREREGGGGGLGTNIRGTGRLLVSNSLDRRHQGSYFVNYWSHQFQDPPVAVHQSKRKNHDLFHTWNLKKSVSKSKSVVNFHSVYYNYVRIPVENESRLFQLRLI